MPKFFCLPFINANCFPLVRPIISLNVPNRFSSSPTLKISFIFYKFNEQPYFFRVLCKGNVMLYEVMYSGFSKDSYTTDYYISKKGDVAYERVKQGKIKKQLGDYMKANPAALDGFDDSKFDL